MTAGSGKPAALPVGAQWIFHDLNMISRDFA